MDATANRFPDALEMWKDGAQIMRENLRRRAPRATDEEIEAELASSLYRQERNLDSRAILTLFH